MTESNDLAQNAGALPTPNPTSSLGLFEYYRDRLEHARKHLPEARCQLKDAGVKCVHIDYDGCGDSGQIESIGYTDHDGKPIDAAGKIAMTENQLLDLFYDLIQARHPGWENNDGAFGEFAWDLITDTLNHTHNDRYTDFETTEHEGL